MKANLKKLWSQITNQPNTWDGMKKQSFKNMIQNKKNRIKIIRTKFDIKLTWNQILRDEIEKKNQLRKESKTK